MLYSCTNNWIAEERSLLLLWALSGVEGAFFGDHIMAAAVAGAGAGTGAAVIPGVEQVVELFQNQRYRKFKVSKARP